jgi:uncharacterized membrane protein
MRKGEIAALVIIALSFIIGIYFYNQFPDRIASHWNAQGQVDGYMSKFWGLFLMPIISVAMFGLFILIPRIDPLKKNIQQFRKYFDRFIVLIFLFLLYLYILTILWNLSFRFNMVLVMVPAFSALFYYAGVLTEKAKRNWFIGIKTPWTLSNEIVWKKTHKLGGKLFKICAIISLLGFLFQQIAIWLLVVPALLLSVFVFVYSYIEFHKIENKGGKKNARKRKR